MRIELDPPPCILGISELTTMTSVSVRFEEMTASHRFELQSETKDDHQHGKEKQEFEREHSVL